ncbi:MAG: MFS transporter, partial [Thaumarchaeota archaeon]|nr:MFS transporter [Nitrososphaerota archaeon]
MTESELERQSNSKKGADKKETEAGRVLDSTYFRRRWVAVSALGVSLFLSALDATIVALAVPQIASSLRLSDSLASVIFLSYAIPLTLLVLPSGALLNRLPVLPTFLVSVLGFGLGSLICGLSSSNFVLLLSGRIVQGGFAALISTQGFAVAGAVVSPKERGRAMGIVGTIAPLGGVAGPGIGGLLLANFGWQSIFFVNLPICLLAAALGAFSLKGVHIQDRGTTGGSETFRQMVGLLRHRAFLAGLVAFLLSVTTSVALYFLLPFDLGSIQDMGPSLAGVILLLVPLGMTVTGMVGGYLTDKYRPRPLIIAGTGLMVLGAVSLSLVVSSRTSEFDLAWRLLMLGGGIGLFSSSNSTVLIGFGGRESMATASALLNLGARLGTVIGPLVMGLTWASVAGLPAQIAFGMLIVDVFAVMTLLSAALSVKPQKP